MALEIIYDDVRATIGERLDFASFPLALIRLALKGTPSHQAALAIDYLIRRTEVPVDADFADWWQDAGPATLDRLEHVVAIAAPPAQKNDYPRRALIAFGGGQLDYGDYALLLTHVALTHLTRRRFAWRPRQPTPLDVLAAASTVALVLETTTTTDETVCAISDKDRLRDFFTEAYVLVTRKSVWALVR